MRDNLAPVINGFDCSGIVNRYSFQRDQFYVEGDNGGTLLDGSTVTDALAAHARLSWTLNSLSSAQYAALAEALNAGDSPDTVEAFVFDPALNGGRLARFRVAVSPLFEFAFDAGRPMSVAGGELVLEEAAPIATFRVAPPSKTAYDVGEPLDLSGSYVWEVTPDGERNDITDWCAFDPPAGTTLDTPGSVAVSVTIDGAHIGAFAVSVVAASYYLTPPTKRDYKQGEYLNLSGVRVTRTTADGSEIVTSQCSFNPPAWTTLNSPGTVTVSVSYGGRVIGSFDLDVIAVTYTVTPPSKTSYETGESLDLTGVRVTRSYGGSDAEDITSQCSFNPPAGTTLNNSGDVTVRVIFGGGIIWGFDVSVHNYYYSITPPTKMTYYAGETLNLTGVRVLRHESGDVSYNITSQCTFDPPDGTTLPTVEPQVYPAAEPVSVLYSGREVGGFRATVKNIIASGDWWTLYASGLLHIYYDGDMPNYNAYETLPWYAYINKIARAVIGDSVTGIGNYTFCYQNKLTSVTISDSVTKIGHDAFYDNPKLTDVYYSGSEAQWNAISIWGGNSSLTRATIHYNSTGPDDA